MDQVADLVLTPFRDIVEKGKTALENAGSDHADMAKAATTLVREGERALKRIEPQCQHHLDEFSSNFLDALKENDEIASFRTVLNDLLWEFDDYLDPQDFDATKYTELQSASRKAAPRIYDILMRMRLEPPINSAMSMYGGSSDNASVITSLRAGTLIGGDGPDMMFPPVPSADSDLRQQFFPAQQRQAHSPVLAGDAYGMGIHQPRPHAHAASNNLHSMPLSPITLTSGQLSPPPTTPLPPRPPSTNPWDINTKPGSFRSSALSVSTSSDAPSHRPSFCSGVEDSLSLATHNGLPPPPDSPLPLPPSHPLSCPTIQGQQSPALEMRNPFAAYDSRSSGTDTTAVSASPELRQIPFRPQRLDSMGTFAPRTRARTLSTDSVAYAPSMDESPVLGVAVPAQATMTASRIRVPPSTIPEHAPLNPEYSTPAAPNRRSSTSASNLRVSRQRSAESLRSSDNSEHRGSVFSNPESHSGTVGTSAASSPGGPQNNMRSYSGVPHAVPEEASSVGPALHSDDGLIVVDVEAEHERQRPFNTTYRAPALKPALITSSSSFHVYKGFCKGALEVLGGDIGVTPVRKQTFNGSHTVARCSHCMFELDYKELEYDLNNDDRGNFTLAGMGFRIRMLQKSHVATRRNDEQFYACIICINLGQTVEESDATVFFTQKDLFHHLARHPRPLPPIEGLTIVQEPTIPDSFKNNYDLHVKGPQTVSLTAAKAEEIENMPSAVCKQTIKKLYGMRMLNDHTPAFEMAEGARIVGIEFPERYEGEWCMGFHDGAYASFPFEAVRFEAPPADQIRRNSSASSTGVRAVARWKFAPKYKNKGDWLKFDKGEAITNITWAARGHWCWSGMNAKGKWGIFPVSHIDPGSVVEGDGSSSGTGGVDADAVSLASSGKTDRTEGGSFLARLTSKKRTEKAPPLPRHW